MSIPDVPIYHTYGLWEPRLPGPGDKALCGHVKAYGEPTPCGLPPSWGQPCVVCADLEQFAFDEADEEHAW